MDTFLTWLGIMGAFLGIAALWLTGRFARKYVETKKASIQLFGLFAVWILLLIIGLFMIPNTFKFLLLAIIIVPIAGYFGITVEPE